MSTYTHGSVRATNAYNQPMYQTMDARVGQQRDRLGQEMVATMLKTNGLQARFSKKFAQLGLNEKNVLTWSFDKATQGEVIMQALMSNGERPSFILDDAQHCVYSNYVARMENLFSQSAYTASPAAPPSLQPSNVEPFAIPSAPPAPTDTDWTDYTVTPISQSPASQLAAGKYLNEFRTFEQKLARLEYLAYQQHSGDPEVQKLLMEIKNELNDSYNTISNEYGIDSDLTQPDRAPIDQEQAALNQRLTHLHTFLSSRNAIDPTKTLDYLLESQETAEKALAHMDTLPESQKKRLTQEKAELQKELAEVKAELERRNTRVGLMGLYLDKGPLTLPENQKYLATFTQKTATPSPVVNKKSLKKDIDLQLAVSRLQEHAEKQKPMADADALFALKEKIGILEQMEKALSEFMGPNIPKLKEQYVRIQAELNILKERLEYMQPNNPYYGKCYLQVVELDMMAEKLGIFIEKNSKPIKDEEARLTSDLTIWEKVANSFQTRQDADRNHDATWDRLKARKVAIKEECSTLSRKLTEINAKKAEKHNQKQNAAFDALTKARGALADAHITKSRHVKKHQAQVDRLQKEYDLLANNIPLPYYNMKI